ncbi:MAG TPA: methyl-accepting chemotaxis protein [bacterium]|nr:methyl-accepting chemotaxis protein [bacterium]
MSASKLGLRVVLTVAFSILLVEMIVGFVTLSRQRQVLMDKRFESLQFSIGLLESSINSSIYHNRTQELTQMLSRMSENFSASAFTLFDPDGRVILEQQFVKDYQSRLADLKVQLQSIGDDKSRQSQIVKTPHGPILRYIIPIHNDEGKVRAGLAMEIPLSQVLASAHALTVETAHTVLWVSLALTAFVVLLLWPSMHFLVVNPVNQLRGELEQLSRGEGDLTHRIQVRSRDEIGQMADWFNIFIDKIRDMVAVIQNHSEHLHQEVQSMSHSTAEVSAMSDDMSTTIQQIAKGAEEQASKIADVHHLMQEMQESTRAVEQKARETQDSAEQATQTAQAGGRMVQETIQKMVDLNETILSNSALVHHLGEKSQQISRVVDIISGIAEQTNLLSLNAAIEAARAGEQGKGFAVVAEEIRALADGASRASHEIEDLIQQIQDQTQATVGSMEKSAQEAEQSRGGIRVMGDALNDIIRVIQEVQEQSRAITELVAQQTQRYNQVVNGIQDINAVSEESAASTQEVSASTQEQTASMEQVNATCRELAQMAKDMKMMVEKFKVR